MDVKQSQESITNTLIKSLDRIPVTYKDVDRITWGDYHNSWYISLSVFKDIMLKIEYGNMGVDDTAHYILYLPQDEQYTILKDLLSKEYQIEEPSLTNPKFLYIKKVITVMLFHKFEMKRAKDV